MKIKSIINFATYLLLLPAFATPAIAGCDPPCGPCYECIDDDCVWTCGAGAYCCDGSCCSGTCYNGTCCDPDQCCVDSTCKSSCSGGPYTVTFCSCLSGGGDGWNECSVMKTYHTCICSTNCNDTNRLALATGTSYSNREIDIGRTCNGASYCGVTNVKGVDPIGDSLCFVTYNGCD